MSSQPGGLRVDQSRKPFYFEATGIYVRALDDETGWGSFDIAQLTRESLLEWLHSRPAGFAELVVLLILGHAR